jgi:hypothetical protein
MHSSDPQRDLVLSYLLALAGVPFPVRPIIIAPPRPAH